MEAKKNGRMTLKILSKEFEKKIKSLNNTVEFLGKRLDESEKKVKILEEKFVNNRDVVEDCIETEVKCNVCEFKCESKQILKKHINENHSSAIKCKLCAKKFPRNSDLEAHLEEYHERKGQYKCEHCDKTFILKWRLKKHLKSIPKGSQNAVITTIMINLVHMKN